MVQTISAVRDVEVVTKISLSDVLMQAKVSEIVQFFGAEKLLKEIKVEEIKSFLETKNGQ